MHIFPSALHATNLPLPEPHLPNRPGNYARINNVARFRSVFQTTYVCRAGISYIVGIAIDRPIDLWHFGMFRVPGILPSCMPTFQSDNGTQPEPPRAPRNCDRINNVARFRPAFYTIYAWNTVILYIVGIASDGAIARWYFDMFN
jgi:hypothetical protein